MLTIVLKIMLTPFNAPQSQFCYNHEGSRLVEKVKMMKIISRLLIQAKSKQYHSQINFDDLMIIVIRVCKDFKLK